MRILPKLFLSISFAASFSVYGQSRITFSVPMIYSKVDLRNNWSPPTAVNRQNEFQGTSFSHGIQFTYAFHPGFIKSNRNIALNIGFGYLKERFNVRRPFDYRSPLEPIFYTDHYSYHCLQGMLGLSYSKPIGSKYTLSGNLSYNWLRSFKQDYTPVSNHGYGPTTQTNRARTDFARKLILGIGLGRNLSDRFLCSFHVLAPLYLRWRNDIIFKDDPTTFSHPKVSFGASFGVSYFLKKSKSTKKNGL